MTAEKLILCACCAQKLANDDESACRDFYNHDHPSLNVPAGTVITGGPFLKDDPFGCLREDQVLEPGACNGHGGEISFGAEYWTAETPETSAERISA